MMYTSARPDHARPYSGSSLSAFSISAIPSPMDWPRRYSSARPFRYASYASMLVVARWAFAAAPTFSAVFIFTAIAVAISSCTAKTSSISRSYRSDHM